MNPGIRIASSLDQCRMCEFGVGTYWDSVVGHVEGSSFAGLLERPFPQGALIVSSAVPAIVKGIVCSSLTCVISLC